MSLVSNVTLLNTSLNCKVQYRVIATFFGLVAESNADMAVVSAAMTTSC